MQWQQCLKKEENTQASRHTVQLCTSHAIQRHKGDSALAFNVFALQEASGRGKSHAIKDQYSPLTDDNDAVLVPLHGDGMLLHSLLYQSLQRLIVCLVLFVLCRTQKMRSRPLLRCNPLRKPRHVR